MQIAKSLLYAIHLPTGYENSHRICVSCSSPRQLNDSHDRRCVFLRGCLSLVVAGWASAESEWIRTEIRQSGSVWRGVVANIFADLVHHIPARDPVLVPIPMSGKKGDPLWEITTQVADRLCLLPMRVLERRKCRSTRASVAEVRRQIVDEEYRLLEEAKARIIDRDVVLLDDTVTTGFTMAGVAEKLSRSGARNIFPVCMDRSISPRFRQRLSRLNVICGHRPEQQATAAKEG